MTTKTKLPKRVQLQANCMVNGCVEPAQDRYEVEFYSIYLGEPGDYQWVADFSAPMDAVHATRYIVQAFGCEVDRSQYDEVMQTPAPEPEPRPKGHPHAALMAEYAKDAAETDEPWERWELSINASQSWVTCIGHPRWATNVQYRRKPEPPKTIMVNGFEVPAPLDEVKVGTTVYIASPGSLSLYAMVVYASGHSAYFDRKIVHTTKKAAVAHAKAMLGVDPSK